MKLRTPPALDFSSWMSIGRAKDIWHIGKKDDSVVYEQAKKFPAVCSYSFLHMQLQYYSTVYGKHVPVSVNPSKHSTKDK